jgi:hypothetical protein
MFPSVRAAFSAALMAFAILPIPASAQGTPPKYATRPAGDNSTYTATTAYVDAAAQVLLNSISNTFAPKASPTFTGTVTAPNLSLSGGISETIPSFTGGNGSASAKQNPIYCFGDSWNGGVTPANSCVEIVHSFGGSAMQGGRIALGVFANLSAASNASNGLPQYVAVSGQAQAAVNEGGTSSVPRGNLYGMEPVCALMTGATYWDECTGAEFNTAVQTGASVAYKALSTFVGRSDDAVQGSAFDAVLAFSNQPGAVSHKTGILLGNMNGIWPFDTTSCLVCTGTRAGTSPTYTLGKGIDLSTITISGNAYASKNFSVDGSGNVRGLGFFPGAGTFAGNIGQIYTNAGLGLVIAPNLGTTNDFSLVNVAGTGVAVIPTGTTLFKVQSRFALPFSTPATATSACVQGEMSIDATYIYTCVATNSWHRVSNGAAW